MRLTKAKVGCSAVEEEAWAVLDCCRSVQGGVRGCCARPTSGKAAAVGYARRGKRIRAVGLEVGLGMLRLQGNVTGVSPEKEVRERDSLGCRTGGAGHAWALLRGPAMVEEADHGEKERMVALVDDRRGGAVTLDPGWARWMRQGRRAAECGRRRIMIGLGL